MMTRLLACILTIISAAAVPAEESIFGINGTSWSHLGANKGDFDREHGLKRLAALEEAGARWDRCDFWWGRIEPEKGRFVWDDYDWIIEQYRDRPVGLMPILCYFSAWSDGHAPVTDQERRLFARYVFETVSRYRDVVKVWQIWNEPNITEFWKPTPNAKDYFELLKVSYEAAKRADPDCIIVGASTAGADFAFIEDLLAHGGGRYMDAISVHPYQGDLGSLSPDDGGLGPTLRGLRTMLAEHGLDTPIWITEMGHRTPGGEGHTHVSERRQASYLVRSYVIAQAAGVQRLFWFNLQDWSERWGIIDMEFGRKPSFTAYQTMTRFLEGKRPIGTLDLGEGIAAYVYAGPGMQEMVAVVWASDDQEHRVEFPGDDVHHWDGTRRDGVEVIDGEPLFITGLDGEILSREATRRGGFGEALPRGLQPLPAPPEVAQVEHRELLPPSLPRRSAGTEAGPTWHVDQAHRRFAAALAFRDPVEDPRPLVIAAERVPAALRQVELFQVVEIADDASAAGLAQRDMDGNIIFIVTPSDASERLFYLYAYDGSAETELTADREWIGNQLLSIRFEGGTCAREIHLANGYITGGDQVGGLMNASYQDTEGAWPRSDRGEVLEQQHAAGPVLAQYRSKVAFGLNRAEYEFTFTVYDGLPQVSYIGRWLSAGTGATKQVNLGVSFASETRIIGQYGSATLPTSAAHYGRSVVIRPADHPEVTGVLVAPNGRLNTPGWATRSVVGTGLFYDTVFPAEVTAEYFWYERPPQDDLVDVARRHYRAVAFEPAMATGPLERRR